MGAFGSRKTNALTEYKLKLSFSELNFYNSFHGPVVGKVCRTMMCFVLRAGSEVSATYCRAAQPPSCRQLQLCIPFRADTGKARLLQKCIACVSQLDSYHYVGVTLVTMGKVIFLL